jgi:HEAT repeat protein
MQANQARDRAGRELVRAKDEIVDVGEPCAPSLVDMMVLDRIPTGDGTHFLVDDLTRQDCVDMLERMGPPAVPDLLRALERKDLSPKGRRLVALALGGTGDARALDPLVRLLRKDPSWQVRADAATALAKLGDRRALEPLRQAEREDADAGVQSRAAKATKDLLEAKR